jgi:GT2 family glycosyltransferase
VSEGRPVDLSIILVNYNVASLVLQAVESLQRQKFAGQDGGDGRLEILVIDNASSPEDSALLQHLPSSVVRLRNDRNLGFAAANNRGIERASGRYLCFLNPDTRALDGALEAMLQHLYRHPEVGAVGPRIWADDDRTLLLPPGDPPALSFILTRILGEVVPEAGRRQSHRWHRRAVMFWRSRVPVAVPMLSGACIMTSRGVVEKVGGFDPGYFLYYEDADWCRRAQRAGCRLSVVPDAEIVHYYNQSAKSDPHGAQRHAARSRERFVRAHYGLSGALLYRVARSSSDRLSRSPAAPARPGVIDLGRPSGAPTLGVTGALPAGELMVEIGYDWLFLPSVAAFPRGPQFQLPPAVWNRLQPGRYCARMVDVETLGPLALWSWEKA